MALTYQLPSIQLLMGASIQFAILLMMAMPNGRLLSFGRKLSDYLRLALFVLFDRCH